MLTALRRYIVGKIPFRRNIVSPPKNKIFVGNGDFRKIGNEFFRYFIKFGKLKPTEKILDVGCGIGRMAVPLTKFLDKKTVYEGFDIVVDGIDWCKKEISSKFPNFHFQLADIYNKAYNPAGKNKASEYRFPYENEYFDFVFLTSVFTHMLPADMDHYISEIARVLKKDGRCFITFFLLNEESLRLLDGGKSTIAFKHVVETFRVDNIDVPEGAVAYRESDIIELLKKYGLHTEQSARYGSWCGRKKFTSYQDIVLATKRGN